MKPHAKAGARAPRQAEMALPDTYTAQDIEVLEGLEPVRRRPGMYIGGTDARALHHLFAEVLDNAMDEAVAGHAKIIRVHLDAEGSLTVSDDGRGIPVDPHPKFPDKSALEVIMTTLHSGGKFGGKAYETSGGLHGVGISVVNALASSLEVDVLRDGRLTKQSYARGVPLGPPTSSSAAKTAHGTKVRFVPDTEIFGPRAGFEPARLFRMARSKAYLFGGVEIRWSAAPACLEGDTETPAEAVLRFPGGLADFLKARLEGQTLVTDLPFAGKTEREGRAGRVEWAIAWSAYDDGFFNSYCNTIPTPQGGTHEAGLRAALTRGLKAYGELRGAKKAQAITADDVFQGACVLLSVFIREPEFQGQTKEKLATADAQRLVETALKDHFDHWLVASPVQANRLLDFVIERADERIRRRQEKEVGRKTPVRKLRLPGKLADCSRDSREGTELFLVEGDSAGGSAKQARDREVQAILPLRGKILNVASAAQGKLGGNQELQDLLLAIGCATGKQYREDDLRYDKIVIMTDADVDGAHIASLLITFFYRELPTLVRDGHLYLAVPPLYRLSHGTKSVYARNDAERDRLLATVFKGITKVEIGRFKGLGEMNPSQLKETTMKPGSRTLLRVVVGEGESDAASGLIERLMGRKPELRFQYIQERAAFASDLDI